MKIRPDQYNLNTQKWIRSFDSSAVKFSQLPRRCRGWAALIKALVSCAFAFSCSCACLCCGDETEILYTECISSLGQQHHGSHASVCGSLLCGGTGKTCHELLFLNLLMDVHRRERCKEEIPQGMAWQWWQWCWECEAWPGRPAEAAPAFLGLNRLKQLCSPALRYPCTGPWWAILSLHYISICIAASFFI